MSRARGGCLCGAVRIEATGAPERVAIFCAVVLFPGLAESFARDRG